MFENGVKELDSQARNVRKAGLLLTLAGYIFFAEPEDRMDAMLASHKDRKRMLDNYEKLGEWPRPSLVPSSSGSRIASGSAGPAHA